MNSEARAESNISPPPSTWRLLRVWSMLGVQSFGGGVATLALIRRAVVEQHRWVSEEDFTRDWALVNLAPGINLLALAILLGRRIAGTLGIFVCMLGLLLPSAAVTIVITAGYVHVQHLPTLQAAVRGVLPAVLGLGLLTSYQIARPLFVTARAEGRLSLTLSLLLMIGSGLVVRYASWPVLLALLTSGGIAAAFYGSRAKNHGEHGETRGKDREEGRGKRTTEDTERRGEREENAHPSSLIPHPSEEDRHEK